MHADPAFKRAKNMLHVQMNRQEKGNRKLELTARTLEKMETETRIERTNETNMGNARPFAAQCKISAKSNVNATL